jgi:serine/threonine protein kinase
MITQRCLLPNEMQQYLNGWSSEAESRFAELHLSECPDCERTIGELESASTFLATEFRSVSTKTDFSNESQPVPALENRLNATIEKIRNWNGHPPEDLLDTNQPSEQVHTGDFGNYELFEVVGTGGMAEVYRARHKRLQRDVALKLIRVPRRHMAESLNRIEREIRAVGRLRHPAIVNAVDAGEHEGVQFLVTEFIDGIDVSKMVRALGTIPIAEACEIVRVAALGLDHAHANGIVHRDIKPSNLMLDKSGAVKILDFGLVQLEGWTGLSAEVTSVGQLLGTLDYMAPEQADRADHATYRSDIWSLGATLFRLLCGRAPYAANSNQSPLEKLRLLAIERPPRIATLRPDLPPELAELIDRTLDRDPAGRPSSAAHFAEALVPFCVGADLAALTQSALEKTRHSTELVDDHNGHLSSVAGFLSDSKQKRLAESIAESAKLKKEPLPNRRRFIPWAVALLLFGFFSYAGVVIILETQQGQVVIESDASDIQVLLVKDGKVRKQVELVPGENVTHLYAGEYEIRINDGTDSYAIDNKSFVLKRREKVVAKITVNPEGKSATIAWNSGDTGNKNAFGYSKPNVTTAGTDTEERVVVPPLDGPETIMVYPIAGDIKQVGQILSTMMQDEPKLRMEADSSGHRLIVSATARTHFKLAQLIKQIDVPDGIENTLKTIKVPSEPVYQGKTLSDWLSVVKFERNGELSKEAVSAIASLCGDNKAGFEIARKTFLEAVSTADIPPEWALRLAQRIGLSDENVLTVESLLADKSDRSVESTRKLIDLLANDAWYRAESDRQNRVQKILIDLKSKPLLFAGDEGTKWASKIVQSIAFGQDSSPEPDMPFLESVLAADHLGPKVILNQPIFWKHVEFRQLTFVAAFRAIEQIGVDDPSFSNWVALLDLLRDNAPSDLISELPKMITKVLQSNATNDMVLGKWAYSPTMLGSGERGDRFKVSPALDVWKIGRIEFLVDSRGDRLSSPMMDLLLLLNALEQPLDTDSRTAVESIRDATAKKARQVFDLLKESNGKLDDREANLKIQARFLKHDSVAIIANRKEQSSVLADIAIAAIVHEQAIQMLNAKPAIEEDNE